MPTASTAPAMGPITYIQKLAKLRPTSSGPKERAGFIDAPLMGLAQSPARTM